MKKIAKILAMFAIFALAFSFAGCKSDDSDSSDDDVTISGGSTSGNGSSNGSSSGSNTSGGGNSGNTSDNTSGGSSSGGSDTGDSSGSGSESGSTTGGTTSGGGTESGTTGGTTSGGGTESGSTGGTTSGGGSESGSTGGSSSGSTEQAPEGFVKILAASISGSETWTPSSKVFVSGRKLEIASFYMSDHEVTRGEYKAVMGIDPSTAKAYDKAGNELTGDDNVKNNPVNNISWYDALVYCNTLSIKEGLTPCYEIGGKTHPSEWSAVPTEYDRTWDAATCDFTADGFRLPTEAEWEWAARGGESYTCAGSDNIDEVAWYNGNTNKTGTRDVKTKKANGYGLYDMSGNVWEWCWDWYGDTISSDTPSSGNALGLSGVRCYRGSSWYNDKYVAQVTGRNRYFPYDRVERCGFRLVRNAN